MEQRYFDKDGNPISKKEVQLLPPEELQRRSGIPVNIFPHIDAMYEAIAEISRLDQLAHRRFKQKRVRSIDNDEFEQCPL